MKVNETYNELISMWKNVIQLRSIQNVLQWDFETYMPPKGLSQRAEDLALIKGIEHERKTDKKIGELVNILKTKPYYNSLNDIEKRNLYLMEREYNRATKIPQELVEEIAKQTTIATQIWKKAKKEINYSLFKPELEKLLELLKKKAKYINPDIDEYTTMMDEFEPDMTPEKVAIIFNELKNSLIPIIKKCLNSKNKPDLSLIKRRCPIDTQRKLSSGIAKLIGYDFEKGRIDETVHPFTIGYYNDVRITTNYNEDDFSDSFYAVLHESGHGIYDQNLSNDYIYQEIGSYSSFGIHESQSRFFENLIGKTKEFWEYYISEFKEITGDIFSDIDNLDDFVHAINIVEPSKIRILADEVTYSLHVIIRFEIEKDLISGKITVDELPQIWNQKYKEYLNIEIENDSEGVLQDTHWASGYFGYFPSYVLGNIYNGQMLNTMMKDIPNYYELIKKGELKPITDWLINNVHKASNLYSPLELMKKITHEDINPKYFIQYLDKKYSKIYDL